MTQPPKNAVTLERLAQLLDAYGAEPSRWPETERSAALQLIETAPEARTLHSAALQLDAALNLSELPDPASAQLRARVLEIPIRHARDQRAPAVRFAWSWKMLLFALTPCALGFLSGTFFSEPTSNTDDDTWSELAQVVMPVPLSDELGLFEEDAP